MVGIYLKAIVIIKAISSGLIFITFNGLSKNSIPKVKSVGLVDKVRRVAIKTIAINLKNMRILSSV